MKKSFSSASDVIHLFAQRTQNEAHSSNVFFEYGTKLYSYGHHYLLAEFITNSNNDDAVMINDTGYSNTTAKHISWAGAALSQYRKFYTTQTNPAKVLWQLEQLANKLQRARKKEIYINEAESLYRAFNKYKEWINLQSPLIDQINIAIELFRGADINNYMAEKQKAIKKAEQLKLRKERAAHKEALKKFFAFEINRVSGSEDYVRISRDGQTIETTQNVSVPIKEAKILYLMIEAKKPIHGFNIGGYTVIGINGVLKIGCHNINKKNMHEVGQQLLKMNI